MSKTVEVQLSAPLRYSAQGGEFAEEAILILRAPKADSQKAKKHARTLRGLALAALKKCAPEAPPDAADTPEETADIDGNDFMTMFQMGGVDTNELCDCFAQLAPAVVEIGEGHAFKTTHWERLGMDDQDKVVGTYIANFCLPSLSSKN